MKKLLIKFKTAPKPVLFALGFVFLLLFLIPFVFFASRKGKVVVVPPSSVSKERVEEQSENQTQPVRTIPSLQEAKQKEIELLKKQGKYFAEIESSSSPPSSPPSYVPAAPNLPPAPPPPSFSSEFQAQEPEFVKMAKEIKEAVLKKRVLVGKVYALQQKQSQGEQVSTTSETSFDGTLKHLPLVPGKFYKAVVDTTITSANPNSLLMAVLEEGLKGAKMFGKVRGVITDENKLDVYFNRLFYQGKMFKINAVAFSLDKTQGVVSKLQYNILAKIFSTGSLAGAQATMESLREDEEIVINTLWGTEVVQNKTENRFREGVLSGASAAFGEAKSKTEQYVRSKQDIKVILERGTPIYVVFIEE